MYNLIMRGIDEPWNPAGSEMDLGRVLEHTSVWQTRELSDRDEAAFAKMRQWPALMSFEAGCETPARIVWLTDIIVDRGVVHFRFDHDPAFLPIPITIIDECQAELGIDANSRFGEMYRSHWAVKDVDLLAWAKMKGFEVPTPPSSPPLPPSRKKNAKAFIVHGRDDGMKNAVALYLTRIGVEPVILHEQVNAGRTLIAKFFETAATADFAVVLMHPDDVGCPAGDAPQPRARQNVVFELGFFLAAIGAEKVRH